MRANLDESPKAPTLSSKGRELYSYRKHLRMGQDGTMVMGYLVYKKKIKVQRYQLSYHRVRHIRCFHLKGQAGTDLDWPVCLPESVGALGENACGCNVLDKQSHMTSFFFLPIPYDSENHCKTYQFYIYLTACNSPEEMTCKY